MLTAFLALISLLMPGAAPAEGPASRLNSDTIRVLAVHAYSEEYPWTARQHDGFVETLSRRLPRNIAIKTEYLDTKRRRLEPEYAQDFAAFLRVKYDGYRPDAIYVTDDDALRFAQEHLRSLFVDVPVFFSGVNDLGQLERIDRDLVTGVFEQKRLGPNLELIRALFGRLDRVAIVGDGSSTYRALAQDLHRALDAVPEVSARFLVSGKLEMIVDALREEPNDPVVLSTLGAVTDQAGKGVPLPQIIAAVVGAGPRVILSLEDAYMYDGVLGGFVTSGLAQGAAAATLMAAYLDGMPVRDLPPRANSPNEYLFNDRALEAMELVLPDEIAQKARLINLRETWVERHRALIQVLILLLAAAFAGAVLAYLWMLRSKNRLLVLQGQRLARSEQSRARERQLLQEVERLSGTGGWQLDLHSNELMWSPETFRIHEVDADYVPTVDDAIEFYLPADRNRISAAIETCLKDGTPWDLELVIVTSKGKARAVRALGEPVYKDGMVAKLRGSFQDITERKLVEQQLEDARLEAERASRAKSQFLAAMSHELRTPLNAIIGFASIIGQSNAQSVVNAKHREYADDIRSSGEHLLSLINGILDISTIEAGGQRLSLEAVRADRVLHDCLGIVAANAEEKGIELSATGDADPVTLRADRRALRQILLNLLSNALKFTPSGGRVQALLEETPDSIVYRVVDTGPGIDKNKVLSVTEPFARASQDPYNTVEGWGLGLAITNALVESHGGRLEIDSVPGVGTTVSVTLPKDVSEAALVTGT